MSETTIPGLANWSSTMDPNALGSAQALINNFFQQIGLGDLGNQAWQQYLSGQPVEEIILNARNTPQYQARFPAMKQLQQNGQAISEGQYINAEQTYQSLFNQYGIPAGTGYYGHDYLGKLIAGNIAPTEVNQRLQDVQADINNDYYSQAAKNYGIGNGDLVAYYLDPTANSNLLQQKAQQVQAGGEALAAHYNNLSAEDAQYLAQFNLSQAQLQKGFGTLATTPLGALPGESGQNVVDNQTALDAVAGQGYAQQRIDQRRQELANATQGSSQFTNEKTGSGIGSANTGF